MGGSIWINLNNIFQTDCAGMGYRDGFGTTRSVKKVYLWETGGEGGRSLPGRARRHPLASSPPSSSSPSPPSSSPSPPDTPPQPCSYIYRAWILDHYPSAKMHIVTCKHGLTNVISFHLLPTQVVKLFECKCKNILWDPYKSEATIKQERFTHG